MDKDKISNPVYQKKQKTDRSRVPTSSKEKMYMSKTRIYILVVLASCFVGAINKSLLLAIVLLVFYIAVIIPINH